MKKQNCIWLSDIVREKGEKFMVDFLKETTDDELSNIATTHLRKKIKITAKNREKTILYLLEVTENWLNKGWVFRDEDCSKFELIKWY